MANEKKISKKEENLQKTDKGVEMTQDKPVYIPAADIYENDHDIIVYADLPGVDDKNVNITLEDDVLTLIGHQNDEAPEAMEMLYRGYRPGIYRRSFTLGVSIDREKIDAKIKNGVLTLTLPKAEEAKPRKITVNAG
jgi:HSP20 family protein